MHFFRSHKNCYIAKRAKVRNTTLGYLCNIAYEADLRDSSVGSRTSIGRFSTVRNCIIGNFCSISWNVSLGARNHHYQMATGSAAIYQARFGLVRNTIKQFGETPETMVGNDVWIGCNAVILSGVTIGDGAIIGAGAVVTEDVEPYSIVAGVPARHIRYRFNTEIIKNLTASHWWRWDEETLRKNINLFHCVMSLEISEQLLMIEKEVVHGNQS